MVKKQKILSFVFYILGGMIVFGAVAFSGTLFFSSTPSPTTHTLNDIYQKLTNNSYTASIADSFNFPTGEATSTMATVEQIYNLIPTISSSTIATGTSIMGVSGNIVIPDASNVLSSIYFGVNGGTQGIIATQTFSPSTTTISSGYYASSNLSTIDTDLVSSNIATGTNIFGVVGSKVPAAAALTWSVGAFDKTYAQAVSYCASLTEGGVPAGSWRLPYITEITKALSTTYYYGDDGAALGIPDGFELDVNYISNSLKITGKHWNASVFPDLSSIYTTGNTDTTAMFGVRCVR